MGKFAQLKAARLAREAASGTMNEIGTVFTLAGALDLARKLNSSPEDGWSYRLVYLGTHQAYIAIHDDEGLFTGYL